jgi:hypothetical protein
MATKAPLLVRWHALELAPVEAGAVQVATVELENIGAARWRTRGEHDGLFLSYHWLDVVYLAAAALVSLALGAFVFSRVDDQIAIEV